MVVFAYCMNGLPDRSVTSIIASKVALTEEEMTAHLTVLKGKQASHGLLLQYRSMSDAPFPIDLWHRFPVGRGQHPCLFALDGDQN